MHTPRSSTIDSLETAVLEGKLVRVVSWYDNEWGFSNRMVDTAARWRSWAESVRTVPAIWLASDVSDVLRALAVIAQACAPSPRWGGAIVKLCP